MTNRAKPFSLRRSLVFGIAAAVGFSLLSVFFFYLQAQNTQHRLAGEVIGIEGDVLTIRNARDVETALSVLPDARIRGIPEINAVLVGQHVMARGSYTEDGIFEADGLRLIRDRDP